jgi:hypothetical protein
VLVSWKWDPSSGSWIPGEQVRITKPSRWSDTSEWEVDLDRLPPLLVMALSYWWRSEFWNSNQPPQEPAPAWAETDCLAVRVKDGAGRPVAGRTVVALGKDYVGARRVVTNADGLALLEVMRNQCVQVSTGEWDSLEVRALKAGTCDGQGAAPTPVLPTPPVAR